MCYLLDPRSSSDGALFILVEAPEESPSGDEKGDAEKGRPDNTKHIHISIR